MKTKTLYLLLALIVLGSCHKSPTRTNDAAEPDATVKSELSLTASQVEALGIRFGTLPTHQFAGALEMNGRLMCEPQYRANVTVSVGAVVNKILVKEGETVRSGEALAYLSHPELIEVQSRYLSAVHRLAYLKNEMQRQQRLFEGGAGPGKDYELAKSNYTTQASEVSALEGELRLLGINVQNVKAGKIQKQVAVVSPMSGTVEAINVETGEYADPQKPLFHIVNPAGLYADLLVYEKDLSKVRVGQTLTFTLESNRDAHFEGRVYSVGKTFEESLKAVHVRANFEGKAENLVEGMYVKARLVSADDRITAVSEEGVTLDSGRSYVFVAERTKDGWRFKPVEVRKGRTEEGWVEIHLLEKVSPEKQFALTGAYYLMSEMKKAETGEED